MAVKSAQAKQQRTAAFYKAVETKQLSLRLAGEWFVLPKTTANRTLRYRPAVSAVLQTEEHCMVLHCFLSLALGPQHTTHIFLTPLDFNTDSNLLLNWVPPSQNFTMNKVTLFSGILWNKLGMQKVQCLRYVYIVLLISQVPSVGKQKRT